MAHGIGVPIGRHGDEDLSRTNIAAGGVGLTLSYDWLGLGPFAASYFGPTVLLWFGHNFPSSCSGSWPSRARKVLF